MLSAPAGLPESSRVSMTSERCPTCADPVTVIQPGEIRGRASRSNAQEERVPEIVEYEDDGCGCLFRYGSDGSFKVLRECTYHLDALREARQDAALARDREWSNRLQSQDMLHPNDPDVDVAIAWYASLKRRECEEGR